MFGLKRNGSRAQDRPGLMNHAHQEQEELVPPPEPKVPVHLKPTKQVKNYMVLSIIAYFVYVAGLPLWSMFFNDVLNFWKYTCHTPATEIYCFDGILAFRQQRFKPLINVLQESPGWANRQYEGDDTHFGCGIGEGAFPEWQCPVVVREFSGRRLGGTGFTISYFLSTAPATGAMAAVSIFPIAWMWWYGLGSEEVQQARLKLKAESKAPKILYWSLVVYTINYFLLLFFSSSIFGLIHVILTFIWGVTQAVHFSTLIYMRTLVEGKDQAYEAVLKLVAVGLLAFVLGLLTYLIPGQLYGYGFFYGEVVASTCLFAITPAMVVFDDDDEEENNGGV